MKILKKIFNQRREIDNLDAEIENSIKKNSDTAISFAKDFQKDFNYSKESIDDLEGILDYYSNDILKSNPTENQIWSMSIIFGSYLGEVILKNGLFEKGYRWRKDNFSDIPILVADGGWHITPIDKVYKRLVNGKEDSVISFYKVAMEMAQ